MRLFRYPSDFSGRLERMRRRGSSFRPCIVRSRRKTLLARSARPRSRSRWGCHQHQCAHPRRLPAVWVLVCLIAYISRERDTRARAREWQHNRQERESETGDSLTITSPTAKERPENTPNPPPTTESFITTSAAYTVSSCRRIYTYHMVLLKASRTMCNGHRAHCRSAQMGAASPPEYSA